MALGDKSSFSRFIIRIAIIAISLSVAVMIISACMVTGFSKEIKKRIFGFWGEVHIENFEVSNAYETLPVNTSQLQLKKLKQNAAIKNIAPYIIKPTILKTKKEIEGIILKGVDSSYDWKSIMPFIRQGRVIHYVKDTAAVKEILVSQTTADKLNIKLGDKVIAYFIKKEQSNTIGRKLEVVGIYHTGLDEYDKDFALVDMRLLQELNQWKQGDAAGYEVRLWDMNRMNELKDSIYYKYIGQELKAVTMREENLNIFEWLDLQRVNEYLILGLMIIIAVLNMITALIILILDRTKMIGILKALGADNSSISTLFIYNALYIIVYGLLWGNIIGLGFCVIQHYTGIIKLNEANYYLSVAPIYFNIPFILAVNVGTVVICMLILLVPVQLISNISPLKSIRFE